MREPQRVDKDNVWIDGKQYISLTRVEQMIEESRQSRKTGNITIGVSVDTTELDDTIRKLDEVLTKAKELNKLTDNIFTVSQTVKVDMNSIINYQKRCRRLGVSITT
jgi:ABC-type transporter Mla subunit MlaD